jgi:hypothetical protein
MLSLPVACSQFAAKNRVRQTRRFSPPCSNLGGRGRLWVAFPLEIVIVFHVVSYWPSIINHQLFGRRTGSPKPTLELSVVSLELIILTN